MNKTEQKELLRDFFLFFRDYGEKYQGITIEEFVKRFLKYKELRDNKKKKSRK